MGYATGFTFGSISEIIFKPFGRENPWNWYQDNMASEWKNGLCDCCGDCENCLCGSFCTPCLVYRNAEDLDKSGILYCLLGCFMPCIPLILLRIEAREKYGIEGGTCGDAMASVCCGCCVNIQVANEIKERGDRKD